MPDAQDIQASFTEKDHAYMRRALRLAKRGAGLASPNPMVGAVIVRDGRVIGEGWHRRYGGKHAETEAVEAAGGAVAGADLYCTLEPCCFTSPTKHQPPCTDLIIKNGLTRVFLANLDPHPRVNGEGLRLLRAAGIRVFPGLLDAEGERLNEAFFASQRRGRPFVQLKIAQSLDGRIAARGGDARWITDERGRRMVHRMRSEHDAVLVGSGTLRADDPLLTVRSARGRNPLRVILDSRLSISEGARLLGLPDQDKTLLVCAASACEERAAWLRSLGLGVVRLAADASGRLDLCAVLRELAGRSIRSVLVEGGAAVFTSFVREKLYDKISVFIAPILVGTGVEAVADLGINLLSDCQRLAGVRTRRIGDQLLFEGYRVEAGHVHGHC